MSGFQVCVYQTVLVSYVMTWLMPILYGTNYSRMDQVKLFKRCIL